MRHLASLLVWVAVLLTAGLPLAWLAGDVLLRPESLLKLPLDLYAWVVLTRTLLLAYASALLAGAVAVVVVWSLIRLPVLRWPLFLLMAAIVIIPGVAWAYAWSESVRYAWQIPRPHSWQDLLRVVVTHATALWPVPATVLFIAWRGLPQSVLATAQLDGARGQITRRLLIGPLVAGMAGVFLLSGQYLAAADQSGVVVTSVSVRDSYNIIGGSQSDRIASAVVAGLPGAMVTVLVAVGGWVVFRRSAAMDGGEPVSEPAAVPRRGGLAQLWAIFGVGAVVIACAGLPVWALYETGGGFSPVHAWNVHGESLLEGVWIALIAAAIGGGMGLLALAGRARGAGLLSLLAFLLGGQFLALGLIRVFNPSGDSPQLLAGLASALYATPPFYALAGVALYAWIPLAAASATWDGRWVGLRDQAALDGAGGLGAAWHVILPLAWPGLLAAVFAVFALSLVETQAAALLVPGTPINFMLSNLHTQNYPDMAEAALLMILVCAGLGIVGVVMAWVSWRRRQKTGDRRQEAGAAGRLVSLSFLLSSVSCLLIFPGCDRPAPPEAVWGDTGRGSGQMIYPRAITYSAADDTVWVVDRSARIIHFDAGSGEFIREWNMPANDYGRPVGISVDSEGNVWVPDTHYSRIIVYRPDGTEWFRYGELGVEPGQFIWPTDILVLEDGRVVISEYGSGTEGPRDRVQIFRRVQGENGPTLEVERQIGRFGIGPGEFRRPQSMAMVGQTLWVADSSNHRLAAFDLEGNLLRTIGGEAGSEPGQFRFPYGLDVDGEGNLVVSEFGNNRIQRIDPETGQSLGIWGELGARPGELKYPWGIAFDALRDQYFVLDSGNDRIQVVDF